MSITKSVQPPIAKAMPVPASVAVNGNTCTGVTDLTAAAGVRDASAQHAGQGNGRRELQPAHLWGAAQSEYGGFG